MLRPLVLLLCSAVLAVSSFAFATPGRAGGPRLRPQDSRTAKFIDLGFKRSATMRALIDRIEASNVIVYVRINPMMRPQLSGALTFVTTSGGFRYVRAMINADQAPDLMIATLAHEFQHVVEVIDNPSVVDEQTLVSLYQRIGVANTQRAIPGWETAAAQAMGAQVRRELNSARTLAASDLEFYEEVSREL